MFFSVFPSRLSVQVVSNEQVLSPETVLESCKTWWKQHHRHCTSQQTTCEFNTLHILVLCNMVLCPHGFIDLVVYATWV